MPQPRNASQSTEEPAGTEAKAPAKPASAKRAPAKPRTTTAKAATGASKPRAAKATAAKTSAVKASAAKATADKTTAAKTSAARKPTSKPASATRAKAARENEGAAQRGGADDKPRSKPRIEIHVNAESRQLELIAERLRKLNEKIIELGREAGESRLTSYEKTLKNIAGGISQGPAKDELEWITQLAASQAKFVREITDSLAKAARDRFK